MATGIVNPHSVAAAAGGGFSPETDINWHTLFWAEGTKYKATNTVNTAPILTVPDEYGTAADDATSSHINSGGSPNFSHRTGTAGVLNAQPHWNSTATSHGTMSTGYWVKAPPYVSAAQNGSTVIIIFEPNNPITTHTMLMSAPVQSMGYFYMQSNTSLAMYGNSGGNAGAWGSSLYPTLGAVNALRWTRSTASSYVYLNGLTGQSVGAVTQGGYARYGYTTAEGVQLCSYNSTGSLPFQGAMAFMGIYSDNNGFITSDAKWNDLKAWALSHYGATLT